MKKNEAIITDNLSSMIMQSLHDLYVEHSHVCNLIAYAGLSILLALGTYKEYVAVSNNTSLWEIYQLKQNLK